MAHRATYHSSPRARQKRSDALETALGALVVLLIAMPLVALVGGLSWRLFTWIAG